MTAAIALQIERWAAWAPGLDTPQAWPDWLRDPRPLAGGEPAAPALAEVPALVRRRIDPLGRMALQVAYWAQQDLDPEQVQAMPLVFASRWGELARSVEQLQALAAEQALSPTAFSHSVHNAVAALYSIQRGIRARIAAVAAGAHSAEAGWLEVLGLLASGEHESALLVVYDAALPSAYRACLGEPALQRPHAYALRLRVAPQGLRLQAGPALAEPGDGLPASLRTLGFCLGTARALAHGPWRWSRT